MKKAILLFVLAAGIMLFAAAASAQENTCSENDFGMNIYAKGTTTIGTYSMQDYCTGEANTLKEYFCDRNGNIDFYPHNCYGGCADGACIKQSGTCSKGEGGNKRCIFFDATRGGPVYWLQDCRLRPWGVGVWTNLMECPEGCAGGVCIKDLDQDSIPEAMDNCPNSYNAGQADSDADGTGNACDNCPQIANPGQADSDNDAIGDACDNCPSNANPGQKDSDLDGIGDECDACPIDAENDADKDTICGNADNCPLIANPGQFNSDSDAIGDACDNCQYAGNPGQEDSDNDAIGDACDNWLTHNMLPRETNETLYTHVVDLDRDRDSDIIVSSSNTYEFFRWYQNMKEYGAMALYFNMNPLSKQLVEELYADDLDNDGDIDIIGSNGWYENGSRPVNFIKHSLRIGYPLKIATADLDNDGDKDIITKQKWLENSGTPQPTFTEHELNGYTGPTGVQAVDLDKDNDIDILATNSDFKPIWLENDGNAGFTEHSIATNARIFSVYAEDLDKDNDIDIIASPARWFENNGGSFTEHILTSRAGNCQNNYNGYCIAPVIKAADLDNDNYIDILDFLGNKLTWFENNGSTVPSFKENLIANGINLPGGYNDNCHTVDIADFDRDRDIDILCGGSNGIYWIENILWNDVLYIEPQIEFNGENEFMRIDDDFDPGLNKNLNINEYTIAFWFKADAPNDETQTLIAKEEDPVNGKVQWAVELNEGKARLWYEDYAGNDNSDDHFFPTGSSITQDSWHHFAATRNIDGKVGIYLDGELELEQTDGVAPVSIEAPATIGAITKADGTMQNYFDGVMGEIFVYSTVFSASDVKVLLEETRLNQGMKPLTMAAYKAKKAKGIQAIKKLSQAQGKQRAKGRPG